MLKARIMDRGDGAVPRPAQSPSSSWVPTKETPLSSQDSLITEHGETSATNEPPSATDPEEEEVVTENDVWFTMYRQPMSPAQLRQWRKKYTHKFFPRAFYAVSLYLHLAGYIFVLYYSDRTNLVAALFTFGALAVYCYYKASTSNPGYITTTASPTTPPSRVCRTCSTVRLWRSKHCSHCNRCVERMDHHCPWINNCVGRNNFHYFTFFLLFQFVDLSLGLFFLWEDLSVSPYLPQQADLFPFVSRHRMVVVEVALVAFYIMVDLAFAVGAVYRVVRNVTTNELINYPRYPYVSFYPYRNDFDKGVWHNFLVFLNKEEETTDPEAFPEYNSDGASLVSSQKAAASV